MLRAALTLLLLACSPLAADPVRLLVIGDSLSEEYTFELTFSAPLSSPLSANARNWPEIFATHRFSEITPGTYEGTLGAYTDFRNAGHRLNFGIPGYTVFDWIQVLATDSWNPITDPVETLGYFRTYTALRDELLVNTDIALIFLGGNDLKNEYNDLFNDTEPATFFTLIQNRLDAIHGFVRTWRPTIPIIVATLPDVGATPVIYQTYTTPSQQASTRAKIASFNQDLVTHFTAKPSTYMARIDHITDLAFDFDPFHIRGNRFTIEGDSENSPDRLFCRDNFHPNTLGQALIANEIIAAVNEAFPNAVTPFSDQEIVENILGFNPDRPFHEWIAGYPVSASGMDDDPDFDRLPNLVELALGTPPHLASTPFSGAWEPGSNLSWSVDEIAAGYLALIAEESTDLNNWNTVPVERTTVNPDGSTTITPPGASAAWLRFRAEPH